MGRFYAAWYPTRVEYLSSPILSALALSRLILPVRYYFNLTDGEVVIRDEDGVEAPDIQAAVIYAMEVIEELRAEDPSNSETWAGWRLEIVDTLGRTVQCVALNTSSVQ